MPIDTGPQQSTADKAFTCLRGERTCTGIVAIAGHCRGQPLPICPRQASCHSDGATSWLQCHRDATPPHERRPLDNSTIVLVQQCRVWAQLTTHLHSDGDKHTHTLTHLHPHCTTSPQQIGWRFGVRAAQSSPLCLARGEWVTNGQTNLRTPGGCQSLHCTRNSLHYVLPHPGQYVKS
jgi:hypothetical protein